MDNNYSTMLGDMVSSMGSYLKPQKAFTTDVQSYDQFAAPQNAVFDEFTKSNYRPEFEQQTLNPWRSSYANQAAAGGMNMMGNARPLTQRRQQQVEQPYYNQLESSRGEYNQFIRNIYNDRIKKYYNSPTSFTNY